MARWVKSEDGWSSWEWKKVNNGIGMEMVSEREAMKDKLYEWELWREREREFGCNEVYGGGWVMRWGRVSETKVRRERERGGEGGRERVGGCCCQTAVPLLVHVWICVFKKLHCCAFALLSNQDVGERIDGLITEQGFEASSCWGKLY